MSGNEPSFDYGAALASGNFGTEDDSVAIEAEAKGAQQGAKSESKTVLDDALARLRGGTGRTSFEEGDLEIGGSPNNIRNLGIGAAEGFQGLQQMGMEALVGAGLMDEDTLETFNRATKEERDLVTRAFEDEYGKDSVDGFFAEIQRGLGRGIPAAATLPLGSGMAGTAATIGKVVPQGASIAASAGRAALGSAAGALGAATEFVEENGSRAMNAAIGSFFGGALNIGLEAPAFIRNRVKRFLQGKVDEVAGTAHSLDNLAPDSPGSLAQKQALTNAEEAKKLQEEIPGLDLAPDQIMPTTQVKQTMDLARKSSSIQDDLNFIYDAQPKAISAYVDGMIEKLKSAGGRGKRFGIRAQAAFEGVVGKRPERGKGAGSGLLGKRATDARRDYAAAQKTSGGKKVIPTDNFINEMNDIISTIGHRSTAPFNVTLAKKVKKSRDKLQLDGKPWKGEPITLNANELQDFLHTYGSAAEGSGRIWDDIKPKDAKVIANRLFGALKDDLNAAIKNGVPGANELRIARDNFATNSAKIKEVETSFIGRLLGGKNGKIGSDIEKAFLSADAEEMGTAMKMLETADPTLRKSLQSFWLESHVKKAMRGGPAGASEDVVRLVPGKLLDMVKGEGVERLAQVFPGAERGQVDKLLQVTAAVINNNNRTGGMTATRLKDLAGVLASMDNTFLARISADMLAPPMLAKWAMGGSEIAKAMTTFAKPFDRQQWLGSLQVMGDYLLREWPETAAEMSKPESEDGN